MCLRICLLPANCFEEYLQIPQEEDIRAESSLSARTQIREQYALVVWTTEQLGGSTRRVAMRRQLRSWYLENELKEYPLRLTRQHRTVRTGEKMIVFFVDQENPVRFRIPRARSSLPQGSCLGFEVLVMANLILGPRLADYSSQFLPVFLVLPDPDCNVVGVLFRFLAPNVREHGGHHEAHNGYFTHPSRRPRVLPVNQVLGIRLVKYALDIPLVFVFVFVVVTDIVLVLVLVFTRGHNKRIFPPFSPRFVFVMR